MQELKINEFNTINEDLKNTISLLKLEIDQLQQQLAKKGKKAPMKSFDSIEDFGDNNNKHNNAHVEQQQSQKEQKANNDTIIMNKPQQQVEVNQAGNGYKQDLILKQPAEINKKEKPMDLNETKSCNVCSIF